MGRCGKPFCTCCETAYVEGFCDGYKTGFTRGHKAGYVSGYLDGHTGMPPLPEYEPIIRPLLQEPITRRLSCGCLGTCVCYLSKPSLPVFEPKPLPSLRLACGCYGTCTCYLDESRQQLSCGCIGRCCHNSDLAYRMRVQEKLRRGF